MGEAGGAGGLSNRPAPGYGHHRHDAPPLLRPKQSSWYRPGTLAVFFPPPPLFFLSFFIFYFFLSFFVVLRVLLPCSFFVRFALSLRLVVFHSFLVSLSSLFLFFRFPAFLGGGFCYSVVSSRRYTPSALLASLKYEYSPFVLSLLALLMLTYFLFFVLFSSFPVSISVWTLVVSSCLFRVGTMLSPRFQFLLRLV